MENNLALPDTNDAVMSHPVDYHSEASSENSDSTNEAAAAGDRESPDILPIILIRHRENVWGISDLEETTNFSDDSYYRGVSSDGVDSRDGFSAAENASSASDVLNVATLQTEQAVDDASQTAAKKVRDEEEPCEEPPEKKEKRSEKAESYSDDDDGQTCSICLESWSNFGAHRLCSLKCGHLFGHSCIMRWVSQKLTAQRTCPTCKAIAKAKDVRFIYAKKVKMCDNYELFTAQSELSKVFLENNKLKLDLLNAYLHRDTLKQKNTELEEELKRIRSVSSMIPNKNTGSKRQIRFSAVMFSEITNDDSCRVFAYSSVKDDLLITQKVQNNIFPGYGIRTVNCGTGRLGNVTVMHPKIIRDIAFSERNNLLLTASFDKTAKLFCDRSGSIMGTLQCESTLWSCCWDAERTDRLYLGGVGRILQYDIRQPRSCVATIDSDDCTPIIMVTYLPNGILSCHLNSIKAHRKSSSTSFESKTMPLGGSLLSARAIDSTVLVSGRPNSVFTRSRNVLCDIDLADDFNFCEKGVFFSGPVRKLLSRSCLMDVSDDETLAVADNESERCVQIWRTTDGNLVDKLPSSISVIDTLSVKRGGDSFLATLTQRSCKLYKAVFST